MNKSKLKKKSKPRKIEKTIPEGHGLKLEKKNETESHKVDQTKGEEPVVKTEESQPILPVSFNQNVLYYFYYNPLMF